MQMTSLASLASAAFASARASLKDMAETAAAQSKPAAAESSAAAASTSDKPSEKPGEKPSEKPSEKPALGAIEQAVADRQAAGMEPKPVKVRQGLSLDSYA
ncbi:hypothetical protein AB0J83_09510 [Actinoplanes sp. NPDC049596]|uniref:hypothetical protein n=1 Tax=unclassified Actinoplanes TaxID=2626549 RepID=UPI003430596B